MKKRKDHDSTIQKCSTCGHFENHHDYKGCLIGACLCEKLVRSRKT